MVPLRMYSILSEVVISVVVLEESPCPRGSSRTNFQVLVLVLVLELQVLVFVLVLESQVLDNNTGCNTLHSQNNAPTPCPALRHCFPMYVFAR